MGKITKIVKKKDDKERTLVFIDYNFCFSVRSRTWVAFNLSVGDEADCENLKEKEKFIWKNLYGVESWKKEKIRLNYVSKWLKEYIPHIDVKITGFGADSTEIIKEHPEESGEPDLKILLENTNNVVMLLEVTGTEHKRGSDYWVRPDKLDYIQKHHKDDIWIALHYADDKKIIWINPDPHKTYKHFEINLYGAIEYFVSFDDDSPEVKTSEEFKRYIDSKVNLLIRK